MPLSLFFSLILKKDLKVSTTKESGRIVAHKNVHRFKWKLRNKELKTAELYLKGAAKERSTVVNGLQPLAARLHELGSKLERLDCFHWF